MPDIADCTLLQCILSISFYSECFWSRKGALIYLYRRWANLGIYNFHSCWKTQHRLLFHCTPEGHPNHPVKREEACFIYLLFNVTSEVILSLKEQRTYLAKSILCVRSSCTDNTFWKSNFGFQFSLTDLKVNKRHIYPSQHINSFAIGFCETPSSHLTLYIVFCFNLLPCQSYRFHFLVQLKFPRELEEAKKEKNKRTDRNQLWWSSKWSCWKQWCSWPVFDCDWNDSHSKIFTYFEEHDVITRLNFAILWVLACLYTVSHFLVIDLLQIVGSNYNLHRRTERVNIK